MESILNTEIYNMAGLLEADSIPPPLIPMDIENTSLHELHKTAGNIQTSAGLSQTIIDSNETNSYFPTGSKIPDTFRTQISFSENSPHICSGSVLQSTGNRVETFDSPLKTTYSIETSSALESVLEHQNQLSEGLSSLSESAVVTTDPESLRFDYPLDDDNESVKVKPRKPPPNVYREQDRFVPINNVGRTMRNSVPKNAKISKDAKQCMQECVSEFISFLTSEASDRCIDEKRKTITGDDILFALSTLGFDNYVDPLQNYLQKYRQFVRFDKPSNKDDDDEGTTTTPMQSFYSK